VDRSKGKFRSFLLKSLNHFLVDEWRRDHAQKRGGSQPALSLDTDDWEKNFAHELKSDITPEKLFERRWALALFEEALSRLRDEFLKSGKEREFDLLKEFLGQSSTDGSYSNAAGKLELDENTVAVRVHRLRRRYAQMVREEVARTVVETDEIDTELNHLLNVICG
jgi:RNA polymerase sigma-70 factor (ECF subfamily)